MNILNATPEDLALQVLQKVKNAKTNHPTPPEVVLSQLFKILFYTSLKTEEDQHIKVTITLIDPNNPDPKPPKRIVADRWQFVKLDQEIPFTVKNLVKLSKAADVWSSSLAVYYDENNDLSIWGMIDQAIHYQSFLNYESDSGPEQPGIFQSTITGIGSLVVIFDYDLIANLKQDVLISDYIDVFRKGDIKDIFIRNSTAHKKSIKDYIEKEFPEEEFEFWESYVENIISESFSRILLRIQNYKHGGAILITEDSDTDLDIKYSLKYNRLSQAINKVAKLTISNFNYANKINDEFLEERHEEIPSELYLEENISEFEKRDAKDELKGAIRFVASLSCVDGLVMLDNNLNVKGFGTVVKMNQIPDEVYISKTANMIQKRLVRINPNNYGTRHRSMFSYCWNHPGSIGFVISQDSDIRAISRIKDRLVMWENIKVQQFITSKKLKKSGGKKKTVTNPT